MALTITTVDLVSTTASGQNGQSVITGAATSNSAIVVPTYGSPALALQVTGAWSGTLAFEGSSDGGTTYTPTDAMLQGLDTLVQAVTSNCVAKVASGGNSHIRLRATAAISGTASVSPLGSTAPDFLHVLQTNELPTIIQVSPAITSGSAYSAFNILGGIQTITGAVRRAKGNGLIESVSVMDTAGQKPTISVLLFNALPSGGTYTDKGNLTLGSTDYTKFIGLATISAANYAVLSGTSIATVAGLISGNNGLPIQGDANGNIYAIAVTGSTPTFTSPTGLTFTYGIIQS